MPKPTVREGIEGLVDEAFDAFFALDNTCDRDRQMEDFYHYIRYFVVGYVVGRLEAGAIASWSHHGVPPLERTPPAPPP
jgi:hypothetical protein